MWFRKCIIDNKEIEFKLESETDVNMLPKQIFDIVQNEDNIIKSNNINIIS